MKAYIFKNLFLSYFIFSNFLNIPHQLVIVGAFALPLPGISSLLQRVVATGAFTFSFQAISAIFHTNWWLLELLSFLFPEFLHFC